MKIETFLNTIKEDHKYKAYRLYENYNQYILNELFNQPLHNINKVSSTEYIVGDGKNIEAKYWFRKDVPELGKWSIHWEFTNNNKDTSNKAWMQVTSTSFKVIDDFIKNNRPKTLSISGNTEQKTNIYKSKSYIEHLNMFNNLYNIDNSSKDNVTLNSLKESIYKHAKNQSDNYKKTLHEALYEYKTKHVNSNSKIERWNNIKKQIYRITLREVYKLDELEINNPNKFNFIQGKWYEIIDPELTLPVRAIFDKEVADESGNMYYQFNLIRQGKETNFVVSREEIENGNILVTRMKVPPIDRRFKNELFTKDWWKQQLNELEVNNPILKSPLKITSQEQWDRVWPILKRKGYMLNGGDEIDGTEYWKYLREIPWVKIIRSPNKKIIFSHNSDEVSITKPSGTLFESDQHLTQLLQKHKDEIKGIWGNAIRDIDFNDKTSVDELVNQVTSQIKDNKNTGESIFGKEIVDYVTMFTELEVNNPSINTKLVHNKFSNLRTKIFSSDLRMLTKLSYDSKINNMLRHYIDRLLDTSLKGIEYEINQITDKNKLQNIYKELNKIDQQLENEINLKVKGNIKLDELEINAPKNNKSYVKYKDQLDDEINNYIKGLLKGWESNYETIKYITEYPDIKSIINEYVVEQMKQDEDYEGTTSDADILDYIKCNKDISQYLAKLIWKYYFKAIDINDIRKHVYNEANEYIKDLQGGKYIPWAIKRTVDQAIENLDRYLDVTEVLDDSQSELSKYFRNMLLGSGKEELNESKQLLKETIINKQKYIKLLLIAFKYCINDLNIPIPKLKIINNPKYTQKNNSYGGYIPSENKIFVVTYERTLADAMRSLCHECYHSYQNYNNILTPDAGQDGDTFENEANAYAGKMMRKLGKQYPGIFFIVCENNNNKIKLNELEINNPNKFNFIKNKWYTIKYPYLDFDIVAKYGGKLKIENNIIYKFDNRTVLEKDLENNIVKVVQYNENNINELFTKDWWKQQLNENVYDEHIIAHRDDIISKIEKGFHLQRTEIGFKNSPVRFTTTKNKPSQNLAKKMTKWMWEKGGDVLKKWAFCYDPYYKTINLCSGTNYNHSMLKELEINNPTITKEKLDQLVDNILDSNDENKKQILRNITHKYLSIGKPIYNIWLKNASKNEIINMYNDIKNQIK